MLGVVGIQNYDLSSSNGTIHLITDSFVADDINNRSFNFLELEIHLAPYDPIQFVCFHPFYQLSERPPSTFGNLLRWSERIALLMNNLKNWVPSKSSSQRHFMVKVIYDMVTIWVQLNGNVPYPMISLHRQVNRGYENEIRDASEPAEIFIGRLW